MPAIAVRRPCSCVGGRPGRRRRRHPPRVARGWPSTWSRSSPRSPRWARASRCRATRCASCAPSACGTRCRRTATPSTSPASAHPTRRARCCSRSRTPRPAAPTCPPSWACRARSWPRILVDRATEVGVKVRLGTTFTELAQDDARCRRHVRRRLHRPLRPRRRRRRAAVLHPPRARHRPGDEVGRHGHLAGLRAAPGRASPAPTSTTAAPPTSPATARPARTRSTPTSSRTRRTAARSRPRSSSPP